MHACAGPNRPMALSWSVSLERVGNGLGRQVGGSRIRLSATDAARTADRI